MKRLLVYLVASLMLFATSCSNDKDSVSNPLSDSDLQFTPVAGGAVMHYKLPTDNPDIVGVHVRYSDCYGEPILRTGSVFSDTLQLVGFNEAQENIPCEVSLQMRNGDESAPIHMSFSTLDSDPITFINSMEVESGWNGFSLNYFASQDVKGVYHVFYLGVNPYTQQEDTILLDTQSIMAGGDTVIYHTKQLKDKNTIIVKAEDYRGHIVKQRQWEVEAMETVKHDGIKIYYDNSVESDNLKLGVQYLTDGDTNGWRWFESQDAHKSYTFISKRNGVGEGSSPMYVDIGEQIPTAQIRIYAYLFNGNASGCGAGVPCWNSYACSQIETNIIGQELNNYYCNRLPCDIDVYGCRESATSTDFENMAWEKIGSFKEPNNKIATDGIKACWFFGCHDLRSFTNPSKDVTESDARALTPKYLSIDFKAAGQGDGYRYLKLVFNDTYKYVSDTSSGTNTFLKVLTFNELEVYTKK
ncbi:MAG: DUF4959 domain-containing protein [Prevotella sp.]|jgi:hypothetical protein